jgi:hypothetical protein
MAVSKIHFNFIFSKNGRDWIEAACAMMLRLEAPRSRALPLLLNAADRLMSGKNAATLGSINAFSVSICRSAAAGLSISSVW